MKSRPGKGKEALKELEYMGGGLSYYIRFSQDSLHARLNFGKGKIEDNILNIATWEAAKGTMAEKRAANPGKPQMELFEAMEIAPAHPLLAANQDLKEFSDMAAGKPEYRSALAKKAMSGELGRSMKARVDCKNSSSGFAIDVKYNEKKEKKGEKLREVVNENLAKDARKERDKERKAAQKAQQKQAPVRQSKGPSKGR